MESKLKSGLPYVWIEPTPVTAFERMLIEELNFAFQSFVNYGNSEPTQQIVKALNQALKLPESTRYHLEFDIDAKITTCTNEYVKIEVRHTEYIDKKNVKVKWLKN